MLTLSILHFKISDNFFPIFISVKLYFLLFVMSKNSLMLVLCIISHFYHLFCKLSDNYLQITNYFKHKKGIENNKAPWTHWQNLTNVSNFTILVSFTDLFILEKEWYSYVWNVFYFPFCLLLSLRGRSVLNILVYVFVLLYVPTKHISTHN